MSWKKHLVALLIFFICGECVVRLEAALDLLGKTADNSIAVQIDNTPLKTWVDRGELTYTDDQLRVLVVGDSYIYGGGIDAERKVSKILRQLLQENPGIKREVFLLDVSCPSNHTAENLLTSLAYLDSFQPHILIWGYNLNDVKDQSLALKMLKQTADVGSNRTTAMRPTTTRYRLEDVASQSKLVHFLMSWLNRELRLQGIVLPFGDFYYIVKRAYAGNDKNWDATQELLTDAIEATQTHETQLIVYKMPYFNMLENPALFRTVDTAIRRFFDTFPEVIYLDGSDDFRLSGPNIYRVSKFDGHPNAAAHTVIARKLNNVIAALSD